MENTVKFSIITPVFNTESYLEQCLESILNQTYKNFEIICINDASTDNSLSILKDYAKNDSRIKIINNPKNYGAAISRNNGLKQIQGQYVVFVDSDDYIDKDLLSLCNKKIGKETELIIFGAKTFNEKTKRTKNGQYSSKKFPKTFQKHNIFNYHTVSYNKIYKSEFLINNDIKFNLTKTGEDQIVFIKSMLLAKNIEIIKKDLYTYRKNRENALTNSKIKNDISPIENFYAVFDFLKANNFEERLTRKIKSKYLLKAISWYGKSSSEIKSIYLDGLLKIFEILKRDEKYWWNFFSIKDGSSYFDLKLEYIKSKLFYRMGI